MTTVTPPPRSGPIAWIQLKFASRLARVVLLWSVVAIAIVGICFAVVAYQQHIALAYDLLTLHVSPIGSNAGLPGLVLSTLGYILVPAIVGTIVSALFTKTMRVSRAEYEKELGILASEVQAHLAPPPAPTPPAKSSK